MIRYRPIALLALASAWTIAALGAQSGALRESDALFGIRPARGRNEPAERSPAAGGAALGGVAQVDAVLAAFFHPLMRYYYPELDAFLESPAADLPEAQRSLALKRRIDAAREAGRADLEAIKELTRRIGEKAAEELALQDELNRRVAASRSRGSNDADFARYEEDFWKRKDALRTARESLEAARTARYEVYQERLLGSRKVRDAMRERVVSEIREILATLAKERSLGLVLNVRRLAAAPPRPSPEAPAGPRVPLNPDTLFNPYEHFLTEPRSQAPRRGRSDPDDPEGVILGDRLLEAWYQRRLGAPGLLAGSGLDQSVLVGGQDLTAEVVKRLFEKYGLRDDLANDVNRFLRRKESP